MVYIHHIETLVPESGYSQTVAAEAMANWTEDSKARRYIASIYRESGIDKRYSVVPDFEKNGSTSFFTSWNNGVPCEPTTAQRNSIFARESKKLVVELAKNTVKSCQQVSTADITHLITVSCTGFYNPGPDLAIVQGLDLDDSIQRYHLGFMGCYAAFPAIRMAVQFCEANPDAVVLIACVELCSLHLQISEEVDTLLANAVFADGAAAVVVSAKTPPSNKSVYRIGEFASALVPDGAEDMAWQIGDNGFSIVLSKYVPRIIGANIRSLVTGILREHGQTLEQIDTWAVHPGGKSILDKIARSLDLRPGQIAASRKVLRQYGNMSSATVLFVLKKILESCNNDGDNRSGEEICSLAFGPGLTVESLLLTAQRNGTYCEQGLGL